MKVFWKDQYCPYIESYITLDGFTCPPRCGMKWSKICPLKKKDSPENG